MARVNSFRQTHGIALGDGHPGCVTLQGAARRLRVSDTVVERLIRQRVLPARQVVQYAPWVIEESDLGMAQQ
jgi:hypothetical protein